MFIDFKKNIYHISIIFKFFMILLFLYYNINIISKINIFLSYIKKQYEIKKILNYLKFCNDIKLLKKFKKKTNPKISLISPIYNRDRY